MELGWNSACNILSRDFANGCVCCANRCQKVEAIIVDAEFLSLLDSFRASNPKVPFIIDTDSTVGTNPFDQAVEEGLKYDQSTGSHGWANLQAQAHDEDDMIAIPFTSGTTAKPKGVVYTHRGSYLAALGNVVESGLNMRDGEGRCGYLWTLPMFHAVGWSKLYFSLLYSKYKSSQKRILQSRSLFDLSSERESSFLQNPFRAHVFDGFFSVSTNTYFSIPLGSHCSSWYTLLSSQD